MPRIIAGKYKGRRLMAPKGDHTRPTTDKVKESLFSIIQTHVSGSMVLDVFAGSGQIGLEALSRGALKAYFIERDQCAIQSLKSNIKMLDVKNDAVVLMGDVSRSLRHLNTLKVKFDIVFLDPPYQTAKKYFEKSMEQLIRFELLASDALIIVEHASNDVFDENVMNLTLSRRCKYGTTMLTFYNRESYMEDKAEL